MLSVSTYFCWKVSKLFQSLKKLNCSINWLFFFQPISGFHKNNYFQNSTFFGHQFGKSAHCYLLGNRDINCGYKHFFRFSGNYKLRLVVIKSWIRNSNIRWKTHSLQCFHREKNTLEIIRLVLKNVFFVSYCMYLCYKWKTSKYYSFSLFSTLVFIYF